MAHQEQQASDLEIEVVKTMLRIAADIDHLDQLDRQRPRYQLGANPALLQTAENLRARAEQAAHLSQCPVLQRLVTSETGETAH